MAVCRKYKKRAKMWGFLHEDLNVFCCCRQHHVTIKALSWSEMISGRYDKQGDVSISYHATMLCVCVSPGLGVCRG
jgi:hypothetical protein